MKNQKSLNALLQSLLLSYTFTGIIVLLLSVGICKWNISESMINIGMIFSYIVSALSGGYMFGKKTGTRKFLRGMFIGICYIGILLILSCVLEGADGIVNRNTITTMIICILSGMLGGMLAT